MLRVLTDSLVMAIAYVIAIVPIVKVVFNVSVVSIYRYVIACVLGFVISFLFKYFSNYNPSLNFMEYIGVQSIAWFSIYIVFILLYCVFKKVNKSS